MEIEILEQKENPFLKRKELKVRIKHPNSATPSKEDVKKEIAKYFSIVEDSVKVDYILTKKGVCESFAKVKIGEKNEAQASES